MTTIVVIVLVAVIALALARLTWRTVLTEKHSIDHHEHAMEVLRDLSSRAGTEGAAGASPGRDPRSHVQAAGSRRAAKARPAAQRSRPAVSKAVANPGQDAGADAPSRAPRRSPVPKDTEETAEEAGKQSDEYVKPAMVFITDDLAVEAPPSGLQPPPAKPREPLEPREPARAETEGNRPPVLPPDPDAPRRLVGASAAGRLLSGVRSLGQPGTYRPRFGLAVGLAAVVIAAAAIAGVMVSTRPFSASEQQAPQTQGSSHKSAKPATPAQLPGLVAATSDGFGATYQVPAQNFTVVMAATSGPCWTEYSATANSPILSEGTLTPGQTKTIQAKGVLWIRVGNAGNVALTVNGAPVAVPNAAGSQPYDFSFNST